MNATALLIEYKAACMPTSLCWSHTNNSLMYVCYGALDKTEGGAKVNEPLLVTHLWPHYSAAAAAAVRRGLGGCHYEPQGGGGPQRAGFDRGSVR